MRRRLALAQISTFAAVGLVLAGCGGDAEGDDTAEGGGTAEGGDVTLTVATFNEFGYEDLVADYEEANPGVTVELKKAATANEARDNILTRLAAGSGLSDVEAVEVDWLPQLKQYPDQWVDLGDESVEGRWLDWKVEQATTTDGVLIGYGTDIGPEAICYRADLLEAAGLPSEREEVADWLGDTWEDYFAAGREFQEASDVPWMESAGAIYQAMVNQVEFAYEDADGTVIATENPEVREMYDQVLAASEEGLSAHLAQWSDDWTTSFQRDGFATMVCPSWMLGVIEGNAAEVEGWDIADTFPGGGGNWGGSFLTVPTQSEHPEEAKALAAWLTAPEQQIRAFQSKGTFPSQNEALESEVLADTTNEFFNGAPTGEIFSSRAEAVTVVPFKGPMYAAVNDAMQQALGRVDVDQTDDPESSWATFVNDVEALG
jgi:cellobiose transport system substrate-binding protein